MPGYEDKSKNIGGYPVIACSKKCPACRGKSLWTCPGPSCWEWEMPCRAARTQGSWHHQDCKWKIKGIIPESSLAETVIRASKGPSGRRRGRYQHHLPVGQESSHVKLKDCPCKPDIGQPCPSCRGVGCTTCEKHQGLVTPYSSEQPTLCFHRSTPL